MVHNVTVFDISNGLASPGGKPVLFNFYTEEGGGNGSIGYGLMGTGYTIFVLGLIILAVGACQGKLCGGSDQDSNSIQLGGIGGSMKWKSKWSA